MNGSLYLFQFHLLSNAFWIFFGVKRVYIYLATTLIELENLSLLMCFGYNIVYYLIIANSGLHPSFAIIQYTIRLREIIIILYS